MRVEAEVADGKVTEAWTAGTMYRGIEKIIEGKDAREAWIWAQRICGVCTTVHAIASVRAVENAVGAVPPPNAELIRDLIAGTQLVQDHVIHFYHLHALDWVDVAGRAASEPRPYRPARAVAVRLARVERRLLCLGDQALQAAGATPASCRSSPAASGATRRSRSRPSRTCCSSATTCRRSSGSGT